MKRTPIVLTTMLFMASATSQLSAQQSPGAPPRGGPPVETTRAVSSDSMTRRRPK